MPGNLLNADISFPQLSDGQSSKEQLAMITDYLYMLLEQLRYTLSNLGQQNFNGTELNNIANMITEPVNVRLEDEAQKVAELSLTVNGLGLTVSNGSDSSTISLNANGAAISSANIRFTGVVTFSDLSSPGQTTITGDNIKTGAIRSNNYAPGASGTEIDLANGTITVSGGGSKTELEDGKLCFDAYNVRYGEIWADSVDSAKFYIMSPAGIPMKLEAKGNMSVEARQNLYIAADGLLRVESNSGDLRIFRPKIYDYGDNNAWTFHADGIYYGGTKVVAVGGGEA